MYRGIPARLLLAVAAVLLSLLLSSSCPVAAHRLPPPRPPTVLLLGGGRSPAPGEGREMDLGAPRRRLGQHTSPYGPPAPKPHGNSGSARPDAPPPPVGYV